MLLFYYSYMMCMFLYIKCFAAMSHWSNGRLDAKMQTKKAYRSWDVLLDVRTSVRSTLYHGHIIMLEIKSLISFPMGSNMCQPNRHLSVV